MDLTDRIQCYSAIDAYRDRPLLSTLPARDPMSLSTWPETLFGNSSIRLGQLAVILLASTC